MSIERQAEEVDRVKRSEAGMITNPITIAPERKVADALELMDKFRISGVPVTAPDGRLLGILTNRDLRFEDRTDLPVSELMTKENLMTVSVGTTLEEAKTLLQKYKIEKLLVVDDHCHLKGLITVKDIQKKIKYPNACKDGMGRLRVGAAVGVGADLLDRAKALVDAHVDVLVLDSSHGHSKGVLDAAEQLKSSLPGDPDDRGQRGHRRGTRELIERGADAVKVGIGPGSICTTRIVTGAGMPQVTAIAECARVAEKKGIPIIADGGIRFSGEIVKAIAAGAAVGHDRQPLRGDERGPRRDHPLPGPDLQDLPGHGLPGRHEGGLRGPLLPGGRGALTKLVPEGIEGMVPFKGNLEDVVTQLVGGLRSGMGLTGCASIADLQVQGPLREDHRAPASRKATPTTS